MKPILFNTDMVRAILDGRKTVTRRVIKTKHKGACGFNVVTRKLDGAFMGVYEYDENESMFDNPLEPPYKVGDILYVRETWHKYTKRVGKGEQCHLQEIYGYKASIANSEDANEKWKPSIHMPKEAARLFLRVTNVRVEKLQDMGLEDYLKEGIYIRRDEVQLSGSFLTIPQRETAIKHKREAVARDKFVELWNSTAGKPNSPERRVNNWYANPFVWVIDFEVITDEELKAWHSWQQH